MFTNFCGTKVRTSPHCSSSETYLHIVKKCNRSKTVTLFHDMSLRIAQNLFSKEAILSLKAEEAQYYWASWLYAIVSTMLY